MREIIVANVKIAVVDHEKLNREFIVNVMMYCVNREVLAFEHAEGAKAYLEAGGTIHLLLSEIDMPDMNGLDLLQKVKNEYPDVKFVLMSINSEHEKTAAESGADAFLAKPFLLQDLFDIVQRFIVGDAVH